MKNKVRLQNTLRLLPLIGDWPLVTSFRREELRVIWGTRSYPGTVAPFRAWRGSRDFVAQSPKFHASTVAPANCGCGGSLAQRRVRKKKTELGSNRNFPISNSFVSPHPAHPKEISKWLPRNLPGRTAVRVVTLSEHATGELRPRSGCRAVSCARMQPPHPVRRAPAERRRACSASATPHVTRPNPCAVESSAGSAGWRIP